MENINSWDEIDWLKVNKNVYLLQLRIFRASKDQNWEKVFKIQKLLIKSTSAKYLAVRKVIQDNSEKNTLGIDRKYTYSKKERFELAQKLSIDGKSLLIPRVEIPKNDKILRPLETIIVEDRAKQVLAITALSPQWEAQFEPNSYGFRPGRSVFDAMEAVFLSISRKQKWVLDADISRCFEKIHHEVLVKKCNTFLEMEKQLKAWLKAGILTEEYLLQSSKEISHSSLVSSLLINIALHGLETELHAFVRTFPGYRMDNKKALSFVRYLDKFLVMHQDITVLQKAKDIVIKFLDPLGLQLNEEKTKIVHTEKPTDYNPPGFDYLGFHVVHRKKWMQLRGVTKANSSGQDFITIIVPSEESIKYHKKEIRDIVKSSFGLSQEKLIDKLNPIIQGWALSKKTQMSSKIFQELDSYLFMQTWKWSRRRHNTMPKTTLKEKYYRKIGNRNWVFSFKRKEHNKTPILIRLQAYTDVKIQRHVKVKGNASIYDENISYWNERMINNSLIPNTTAKLIRKQ